ncbi:hypothetical protein [Nitrososphaera sp.]|uniref:hypothetical protein n=1 Tax=Nitrososphaera sp. TaxID=1971748 RepID=UPI00307F2895
MPKNAESKNPSCPWGCGPLEAAGAPYEYRCPKHGQEGRHFWDVVKTGAGQQIGSCRWTDFPSVERRQRQKHEEKEEAA